MKTHVFDESKLRGDAGEALMLRTYPNQLKDISDSKLNDFSCAGFTGHEIEHKTDYYRMHMTDNIFAERFSNDITWKDGGPWKALRNGASIFSYLFWHEGKLFLFNDIAALIKRITYCLLTYDIDLVPVRNKNGWGGYYNTLGYKIPRHTISDLCVQINIGDTLPLNDMLLKAFEVKEKDDD
ncbi:MAG: hypothetical protein DRI65_11380 [Chloroflexota bacterium]|nr:MAG: hypothetical protein DRI65_11380 [Chloroflexota bacterium]